MGVNKKIKKLVKDLSSMQWLHGSTLNDFKELHKHRSNPAFGFYIELQTSSGFTYEGLVKEMVSCLAIMNAPRSIKSDWALCAIPGVFRILLRIIKTESEFAKSFLEPYADGFTPVYFQLQFRNSTPEYCQVDVKIE